MNIILLRHGKTESNLRGAFTGTRDEPLSKQGANELVGLRRPKADIVFSSPMRRCLETAELFYPGFEPIIINDLQERDFGDFEGLTYGDITALPGFSDWGMDDTGAQFPGGEDYADFLRRCRRAFFDTANIAFTRGAENVAVICHGGVIMAVMHELILPRRAYLEWRCNNGCGYLLEWRGGEVGMKGGIG